MENMRQSQTLLYQSNNHENYSSLRIKSDSEKMNSDSVTWENSNIKLNGVFSDSDEQDLIKDVGQSVPNDIKELVKKWEKIDLFDLNQNDFQIECEEEPKSLS